MTIENQLNHRTIREFTEEKVATEVLERLLQVANCTATSTGMQFYSIIRITDKKRKEEISKICNQEYVARVPELLIFVADLYRNAKILEEKGENLSSKNQMDRFFQGFTDACLAAQNMVCAIEELGMGAVYFGSILNDYDRLIELLHLPELTFPVVGLGFGYPNQAPQLKPRMKMAWKCFENQYVCYDNYLERIKDYDEEMTHYYDLRDSNRRSDNFSNQVVQKYRANIEKRIHVMDSIVRQGFRLDLTEKE